MRDELLTVSEEIHAWVILPNHYHLLAVLDLGGFRERIRLLHSRLATAWNAVDNAKGRRVWYRFQDRQLRGERHYFATLNYIHANPVQHGCVARADEWPWSSLPAYLAEHGRAEMRRIWREYPVDKYGACWDEEPPVGS